MKKFVILLLKLAGIFIGINLLSIPLLQQSGNPRFLPYVAPFIDLKSHYDLIILGDSHADDVWRTNPASNILNAASKADDQLDVARKIDFLQRHGVTADKVLYEIDGSQFTTSRHTNNNNDISEVMSSSTPMWLAYYLPLAFNPKITNELKRSVSDLFKRKPSGIERVHHIDTSGMKDRADLQFFRVSFSDSMFHTMRANLRSLNRSGTKVVLISYPLYRGYIDLIDNSTTFQQVNHAINAFVTTSQLPVLDYQNALCNKDHFANQDHVHIPYSAKLTSHILNILAAGISIKAECIDQADTNMPPNP